MKLILSLSLVLIGLFNLSAQIIQTGNDIDGETAVDRFGDAVSISDNGERIVIGARDNGGNGFQSGHVRAFELINGSWAQMGSDFDGDAMSDGLGWSVSISGDGNWIAMGAPRNASNGQYSGHVKVFQWTGASWTQMGGNINGSGSNFFGFSVSLSRDGSRVAIGLTGSLNSAVPAGQVKVFEFNGGNWIPIGGDINGESARDLFGYSVSLSSNGNRVAVGAKENDGGGISRGHMRVFELIGGSWVQMGNDIDGESDNDSYGISVSISGDGSKVAGGSRNNAGNGAYAGHVKIYEWTGSSWVQMGLDIDGEASLDISGCSISLSDNGERIAIGAMYNRGNGYQAGNVRIFDWNGNSWIQVGSGINSEAAGDQAGESVSLSKDGCSVAIGAPMNDGNGYNAGHVRVFNMPCVAVTSVVDTVICFGLVYNGYDTTGVYMDTVELTNLRDSIITLNLTVLPLDSTYEAINICQGQSIHGYNSAGVYVLEFTNSKGCDSIITIDLTINALDSTAVSVVDAFICEGDSLFLGGDFQTEAGSYSDTLRTAAGCDSIIIKTKIEINNLPSSPIIIESSGCLVVNSGYENYQWYYEGATIGSDTNLVSVISDGSYWVEVTDSNGCLTSSDTILLTNVGINAIVLDVVKVFPNPVNDVLQVVIPNELGRSYTCEIYSMIGKKLIDQDLISGQNNIVLDLSEGVYIYKVFIGNRLIQSGKIVRAK